MKNKILKKLTAFVAAALMMPLTAFTVARAVSATASTALASPANITVSGAEIAWDAVENAYSYQIMVDESEYVSFTNSYIVSAIKEIGTYEIKVKAVAAEGSSYTDSAFASKTYQKTQTVLGQVQNLVLDGKTLFWTANDYASSYEVSITQNPEGGVALPATTYITAAPKFDLTFLGDAADYSITVKAIAESANFADSDASDSVSYTVSPIRLNTPASFRISGETASWRPVLNAQGYTVKAARSDGIELSFNITQTSFDLRSIYRIGAYNVSVYATGDGNNYLDSAETILQEYETDDTVSSLAVPAMIVSGARVSWNFIVGARGYVLKVNDNEFELPSNVNSYVIDDEIDGAYALSVKAISRLENDTFDDFLYNDSAFTATQTAIATSDFLINTTSSTNATIVGLRSLRLSNTSITIPATVEANTTTYNVTAVAANAFLNNTVLEHVTINATSTSFAMNTTSFAGCTSLKTVHLGTGFVSNNNSVFGANRAAFTSCINFQGFSVEAGNVVFSAVDGVLYKGSTLFLNVVRKDSSGNTVTSFTVDSSVSAINNYAFNGNTALTSITIEGNATTIGSNAFLNCTSLETFNHLGNKAFNANAFDGCTALKTIHLGADFNPSSPFGIYKEAINPCVNFEGFTVDSGNTAYKAINGVLYNKSGTQLFLNAVRKDSSGNTATSYTISNEVETIADNAFNGNTAIETVIIEGNTAIGNNAFNNCTSLKTVTLSAAFNPGSNPFGSNKNSFAGCTSFQGVNIAEENTVYKSVNGVVYSKDGTTLILNAVRKNADGTNVNSTFVIPSTVTTLTNHMFAQNSSITKIEITADTALTAIPASAFAGASTILIIRKTDGIIQAAHSQIFSSPIIKVYVPDDLLSTYAEADNWKIAPLSNALTALSTLPA